MAIEIFESKKLTLLTNTNNWILTIYCKSFRGICRRVSFCLFAII